MNNYFHLWSWLPAAPLLATPKIPFCLHMRHNDGLSFTGNCKMMLSIYPRINTKQCHTVFMASFAKLLNLYRRRSVAETLVSILRRKSKDAGAVQIPLATLQFMTKTCEEYETFYNNGALCPKEMKDFLRLHVQADVVRKWLAAMMLKHLNWKACVTFFFFFF